MKAVVLLIVLLSALDPHGAVAVDSHEQVAGESKLLRLARLMRHDSASPGHRRAKKRRAETDDVAEDQAGPEEQEVVEEEFPVDQSEALAASVDADGGAQIRARPPSASAAGGILSNVALFSVLVKTPDSPSAESFVSQAILLKCTAGATNMPFHLMYAGLSEDEVLQLQQFGWITHDMSHEVEFAQWLHRPVYTEEEAIALNRSWPDSKEGGVKSKVQDRTDGWATYFKYFAWRAPFEKVLLVDLDVCFTDASMPLEDRIAKLPNKDFLATRDIRRDWAGLDTHMVLLKPSNVTFAHLIRRSKEGDYVPFTNGDEDVLEVEFPPDLVGTEMIKAFIPHLHNQEVLECSSDITTCGEVFRCAACSPAKTLHDV